MNNCICVDCPNKCPEYENNSTSDKAYYEWTCKEDKCKAEREDMLNKLNPCPKCDTFCHVEIIKTMAEPPKNIRIGCVNHSFWLNDTFASVGEAIKAWNRRVE